MGKPLFPQNRLAIQTFGRKMVCRCMGKQLNRRKPVRDTGFLAEKGVSRHGKQLNRRKPVHDWSIGPDESWVTVKISRL